MPQVSFSELSRTKVRILFGFAVGIFSSLLGCAHYYLPANHLETPESRGAGTGRLEWVNFGGASDLTALAKRPSPDPETGEQGSPQVQKAFPIYSFAFSFPVAEKMEAGIRIIPYAPTMLRFKYQFTGLPESEAKKGNWAASVASSAGLLLAQGTSGKEGVSYYLFDLAVPVGYRVLDHHLVSLTPFFSLGGISGVALAAGYTERVTTSQVVTSTSFNQYGAGLGYQYNILSLFFRSELAYLKGSLLNSEIGGISFGVSTGLTL